MIEDDKDSNENDSSENNLNEVFLMQLVLVNGPHFYAALS
jgi:hypothetical protein